MIPLAVFQLSRGVQLISSNTTSLEIKHFKIKTNHHNIAEILLKLGGQQSIKVFLFVSVYLYLTVTCHFPFYTLKITGN
jgi:hypothetical protein